MPIQIVKKPNGTVIKRRIPKRKPGNNGWWSESEKNNAVKVYLKEGSLAEVCRQTNIPEDTLRKWRLTEWWSQKVIEFSKENNATLSGKLGKILEKAMSVVEQRLDKGDEIYNPKTGKTINIGVKAAVANRITKDALEKKLELDRELSRDSSTEQAIVDKLASLKEEFMKFTKSKTIEVKPEDITVKENSV